MRRIFLYLFVIYSFAASTQTLSGVVVDNNGEPLMSGDVLNISQGTHTHTDVFGKFTINVSEQGDTLQVSHIGFQTVIIEAPSQNTPLVISMTEVTVSLDEVVISPTIDALNLISTIDLSIAPVNSSQDVLTQVPGLFIGQHAGGGKAEQIFLRGFDLDHGTDINIAVDDLPVNMVSHAHGHGYADLHFVIPETIDKIGFGKGPYYADQGNFNTAGYVTFKTKNTLDQNIVKLESGSFNTQRLMSMINVIDQKDQSAYIASEYLTTDGPFDSDQNFNRLNIFGKYSTGLSGGDRLQIIASHFTSRWDASGQIPQRAVDRGLINRFGAIDDTEGGETSRTNIKASHKKSINNHSYIDNSAYFSQYQFELFSNFTFFLNDPINGDQIKQRESRDILGFKSEYHNFFTNQDYSGHLYGGINFRNDRSHDNELSRTLNRIETLSTSQLGNINETNISLYGNLSIELGKWNLNTSLRLEYFDFQYENSLSPTYDIQSKSKVSLNPKLNILYNPSNTMQYYVKAGKGFHSNDSRVVIAQNGEEILPSAYGTDFGMIWKPHSRIFLNAALWYLFLEQEFVYVGDEGIVEPSGETTRKGVDLSIRYQPSRYIFLNTDINYTHARSSASMEADEAYIPLAPDLTITGGINLIHPNGLYGSINVKHINHRPANEDNSIIAEGYTVVDGSIGYKFKKIDFGLQIQNLLNTEWNETQFATESRLYSESLSTEEIHFTPGTPFFVKGIISYSF